MWGGDGRVVVGCVGALLACIALAEPIPVDPAVQTLHDQAVIVDLHMDPLLTHRDLLRESSAGDADVPRLRQAGVDLAGFGLVSEPVPILGEWGIRLAFRHWGWPPDAASTPRARVLAQLDALDRFLAADPGLRLVRTRADLDPVRAQRVLGIVASLEGAQAFADDPAAMRALHARGVRVVGLTHLRDNDLGGSGSPTVPLVDSYAGARNGGLTDRGRAILGAMEGLGMTVDLAHASPRTFDDVLAAWAGPVFVSHTAMAALQPGTRNLSDDQVRAIAARGGVIGIMAATNFVGGRHLDRFVDHVLHAVAVAGPDHVSLGLDLDGMITLPDELRDVRDLPRVTQRLHDRGLDDEAIRGILGQNALRFLAVALAPGTPGEGS
ncbi:MAG: membrane dipeptidase [Candidatus Binatia bacterium]